MNSKTTPAIMKMVVKVILNQCAVGSGQRAVEVFSVRPYLSGIFFLHTAHCPRLTFYRTSLVQPS